MRTEHDMLGTRSLSDDTLYGLQTLRAKENFITSYHTTNLSLIYAMVQVKKSGCRILPGTAPGGIPKMGCYPLRLRPDLSRGCG